MKEILKIADSFGTNVKVKFDFAYREWTASCHVEVGHRSWAKVNAVGDTMAAAVRELAGMALDVANADPESEVGQEKARRERRRRR